ncbi:MAG: hypothetical protein J6T99_10975 [Oscillospiraceae bacterium]|nr:hypothetical protein [Oscillospiraceae bacterium]
MAFFNGYPATYQPVYQPPVMQTPQQAQQNGIIWVQGEAGAKSYLVAPNTTVQLWDSEDKVIYLKSADASGMPSMKILDYTIRGDANRKAEAAPEYATRDELNALAEKVERLRRKEDTDE